jgi:hypothetical protein
MAPMASGVADGEKDWLVLLPCQAKGLFRPGMPAHRVVSVLQEIWRFLGYQAIRHGFSFILLIEVYL